MAKAPKKGGLARMNAKLQARATSTGSKGRGRFTERLKGVSKLGRIIKRIEGRKKK